MLRIGLLSDTHSHLDDSLFSYFEECDEIWHAGDIGNYDVAQQLQAFRPFRAVYGNIDGHEIRMDFPENLIFEAAGIKVLMTHIGGYPGRYTKRVRQLIAQERPKLYICGHSHILKVQYDKKYELLHINPGAAGINGFHQMKTAMRFTLVDGNITDVEVIELGKRGRIK
ncbi:MAG: metallophosphoesterase family protein [Bacteroidota bacterium]